MDEKSLPPVRFRAIIEMSFPDANRLDPSEYDQLIEQWTTAVEENPIFNCKDVLIREILTIGGSGDDYEKWRREDLTHVPKGIRITSRSK